MADRLFLAFLTSVLEQEDLLRVAQLVCELFAVQSIGFAQLEASSEVSFAVCAGMQGLCLAMQLGHILSFVALDRNWPTNCSRVNCCRKMHVLAID